MTRRKMRFSSSSSFHSCVCVKIKIAARHPTLGVCVLSAQKACAWFYVFIFGLKSREFNFLPYDKQASSVSPEALSIVCEIGKLTEFNFFNHEII